MTREEQAQKLAGELSDIIFEAIRLRPRPKGDPDEDPFAKGWERAIHTACCVVRECLDNPPTAIAARRAIAQAFLAAKEEERAACKAIALEEAARNLGFGDAAYVAELIDRRTATEEKGNG